MRLTRTSLFAALGLCALTCAQGAIAGAVTKGAAVAAPRTVQDADDGGSFAIPTTRAARALAESTQEHIQAGRWPEALRALQSMVEESNADLLGPEFPTTSDGLDSRRAVHEGAARWATEELLALPVNIREDYRRYYEGDAEVLLEQAKTRTDRRGLVLVASRFPATRSAELALWALGDLELELGNRSAAFHAWQRAACRTHRLELRRIPDRVHWRRLLEAYGDEAEPEGSSNSGAVARIEFVLREFDLLEERAAPESDVALELALDAKSRQGRELRALGTSDTTPMAPGPRPGSWRTPFQLPEHPFDAGGAGKGLYNLAPVRSGDRVLVSTSLEVFCLAAYTGELLWRGGLPDGWADYFRRRDRQSKLDQDESNFFVGVDERYALIAPAASESIAVAALQIPVTHIKNDKYQQIKITRVLPNRRLFAYDLETGEELWNHTPPEGWDGEEGSFSDRMRVAAPPVISGSRVLVPTYRMQGRIDYHVGCFDLLTGEYLWSTALISGQRELNMFGRPEFEFSAAPLRVEGDVVIALTQLGSIAALDLVTGTTLWQVVYDQFELPQSSWGANLRDQTWLNSAPLVVYDESRGGRGVILVAPVDGPYVMGLDFDTGAALWTVPFEGGRRSQRGSNLLLGATTDTVYLGGPKITALRAIGGLRSRPTRIWQTSYGVFDGAIFDNVSNLPRGALAEEHVVFSASNGRALVDRATGIVDKENEAPWKHGGNVLLTPGATFTLSNNWLNGYFEWETLIAQANSELALRPGEIDPAVRLARLRVDRAERHWQDGELDDARRHLEKAHDVLQTFCEGDPLTIRPEVASTMHSILRARARISIQGGELAQAREMLRRARDLAPDARDLRDTLLAEEALWRREVDGPWLEIVSELENRCAGLRLTCTIELVDGETLRLLPLLGPGYAAPPTAELPVELWVRLERARRHEIAGRHGAAFEDLHAVIEEFGFEEIGARSVRTLCVEGIARNLETGGGRGYEPFEERAAEMLERARLSDDTEQVAAVSRFFPHSKASRAAHDVLLEAAIEHGDATEVAAIVDSELPEAWAPEYAGEREIDLVMGLAQTLGRSGNTDYERGLLQKFSSLGVKDPRVAQRLKNIAPARTPELISERSGFNADSVLLQSFKGEYRSIGRIPGRTATDEATHEVALFEMQGGLVAISSMNPTEALWTYDPVEPSRTARRSDLCAVAPGRVLYATMGYVIALDRENGDLAWSWQAEDGEVLKVSTESGVAVCQLQPDDGPPIFQALDVTRGVELWRFRQKDSTLSMRMPVLGQGYLCLLPRIQYRDVEVRDLFTGRIVSRFELEYPPDGNAHHQVWIQDGMLIEPRFYAQNPVELNRVTAYDLQSGQVRWTESFDEEGRRELASVAVVGSERFFVLRSNRSTSAESRPGRVLRLLPEIGALQPVGTLNLGASDFPMLSIASQNELDSPFMFLRSVSENGQRVRLRAIHLPQGEQWSHTLPVAENDLFNRIPKPAVSKTTVVMLYNEWPSTQAGAGLTRMRFIDRASGLVRDMRDLPADDFRYAYETELVPLGDALLLCGTSRMDVLGSPQDSGSKKGTVK